MRRIAKVILPAAAVLGAVILLMPIFGFVHFIYRMEAAIRDMPKRHAEAKEAIEFVYGHYLQFGEWPTKSEIESVPDLLPLEWEYKGGGASQPLMWLHGPHHMFLYYYFEPPKNGMATDNWVLTIEGSKRAFRADEPYSLQRQRAQPIVPRLLQSASKGD